MDIMFSLIGNSMICKYGLLKDFMTCLWYFKGLQILDVAYEMMRISMERGNPTIIVSLGLTDTHRWVPKGTWLIPTFGIPMTVMKMFGQT